MRSVFHVILVLLVIWVVGAYFYRKNHPGPAGSLTWGLEWPYRGLAPNAPPPTIATNVPETPTPEYIAHPAIVPLDLNALSLAR